MIGGAVAAGVGLAAAGTAIAAGGANVSGTKPRFQDYGGSNEQYQAYQNQYESGIQQGNALLGVGTQGLQNANLQAEQNRYDAQKMSQQGAWMGANAMREQDRQAYFLMRAATAKPQGPSLAEQQMRMGLGQTQQAMAAQAASARGGNQAAAMRTAQATGSQMGLAVNQQAGILRAQEEQQRLQNELAARQYVTGLQNQRMGIGFDMQGQGLGLANQSTGLAADASANVGQLGLGSQGQYLDARNAMETAQLQSDTEISQAKALAQQNKAGRWMGFGGTLVGAGGTVMGAGMGGGK